MVCLTKEVTKHLSPFISHQPFHAIKHPFPFSCICCISSFLFFFWGSWHPWSTSFLCIRFWLIITFFTLKSTLKNPWVWIEEIIFSYSLTWIKNDDQTIYLHFVWKKCVSVFRYDATGLWFAYSFWFGF